MKSSDSAWRERGLHRAVLAGDEAAWRAWYDESCDGLYAYVVWRCAGLRDLADEVVQETWLTAVRRVAAFDPGRGPFAVWLRGIAGNVLRNQLRKRCRLEPLDRDVAAPEDDRRGDAENVVRALAELSERYEAVLRAKYFDQLSVHAIAAAWGETPKAIESLLTRARQAFRETYQRLE